MLLFPLLSKEGCPQSGRGGSDYRSRSRTTPPPPAAPRLEEEGKLNLALGVFE